MKLLPRCLLLTLWLACHLGQVHAAERAIDKSVEVPASFDDARTAWLEQLRKWRELAAASAPGATK